MVKPLHEVIAQFRRVWEQIPMCHKCAVGRKHPWHDDGTLNLSDLPVWVEDNAGPSMEGNGWKDNDE